jgi:hypothetical protein
MTCGIVNLGALLERTRRLDALVQVTVQSAALTTPPGSPIEGQRWILPAARTGAWTGHAGQIAAWQDGAVLLCSARRLDRNRHQHGHATPLQRWDWQLDWADHRRVPPCQQE